MESDYIIQNNEKIFIHGALPCERYAAAANKRFLLRRESFDINEKIDKLDKNRYKIRIKQLKRRAKENRREIDRLKIIMKKIRGQEQARIISMSRQGIRRLKNIKEVY